jgi:hypothetical protein
MSDAVERRISRLEKRVAERFEEPSICNCRLVTKFHNAACLKVVLRQACRVCPVHGFRELGSFFGTASQWPLTPEDNEFCPCPSHPWRSFLLSAPPHTWDQHNEAKNAWSNLQPRYDFDLKEDNCQTEAVLAEYKEARERGIATSRRQLPSHEEIVKQEWKRAREHGNEPTRQQL